MTHLIRFVPLIFNCLVSATLLAQTNFWTQTNSGPWGVINSIAFTQSEVLTCGAGIFCSTDCGEFWSRINNEFNYHTVNSLLTDSSQNFFAGTTGGIYYSSDQGSTWILRNSGVGNSTVYAFTISRAGYLVAGTSGPRVFRSSNAGETWQQVALFNSGTIVTSLLTTTQGTLLAGTANYISVDSPVGSIYRSTNNGNTWDTVYVGTYNRVVTALANAGGRLYAGLRSVYLPQGGNILASNDDGISWSMVSFYLPVTGIATDLSGDVFAGTADSGVYRFTNMGGEWTRVGDSVGITAISTSPTDHLWAAYSNLGGLAFTTDGGVSWQSANTGLRNPNVACLAINSAGTVFAGTSQGGGIPYTPNMGNTWYRSDPITSDWINALTVTHDEHILASGSTAFYESTNAGQTWITVTFPSSNLPVYSFALNPQGHVFAASYQAVLCSSDNGENWVPLFENTQANYSVVCDSNGWIFASSDTGIVRSTDNGTTWLAINSGLSNRSIRAMAVKPDGKLFAGSWGGGVFRSTDRGESWIEANSGLTGTYIQSFAVNRSGHIFVGVSGGGVCRTIDDGITWQAINSGLTFADNTRALAVSPSGHLFAGTFARGVFRSVESTTSVNDLPPSTPSSFELAQNYPNPFNPATTIEYTLSYRAHVGLSVFDLLGREVATLVNTVEQSGRKSLLFDASSLSTGIYFYRLQVNGYTQTRKLLLLK
jgi:photosystem II stability/assembly factor-like uncharacterized protein